MRRSLLILTLLAAAAATAALLRPASASAEPEAEVVFVTNFPQTQIVDGAVAVKGTIRQAALASIRDIEVPPLIRPDDTRRLVPAGTISTDGFGAVVLSLMVQVRGKLKAPGQVGAILVPEEEPILDALDKKGRLLFPLEVRADAPAFGPDDITSGQPRHLVGFPRYRVFLYNTTASFATADLYAYLTN